MTRKEKDEVIKFLQQAWNSKMILLRDDSMDVALASAENLNYLARKLYLYWGSQEWMEELHTSKILLQSIKEIQGKSISNIMSISDFETLLDDCVQIEKIITELLEDDK